jgi:hypothetical protein
VSLGVFLKLMADELFSILHVVDFGLVEEGPQLSLREHAMDLLQKKNELASIALLAALNINLLCAAVDDILVVCLTDLSWSTVVA